MSFGGFIFGALLMGFGFTMVYRTFWFEHNFGEINYVFGWYSATWLTWKTVGLLLMLIGFLIAFGIFNLFISLTIGQLFR